MEEKTGVFICTGYGISAAVDADALCKLATDEYDVPFSRTVESCEGSGLAEINAAIESEGLTRVVVAGISPRRFDAGSFPDKVIVEAFALSELVAGSHPPGEEDTQMLAEDYLRMYIAKVGKMELPDPFEPDEPVDKSVLVVGGGITGITAALESARTGYDVRLVEKSDSLGGWLARQHKSVPTRPPYRELEDTGINALITEVEESPRITVYTSAVTSAIEGAPGFFDVELKSFNGGGSDDESLDTFRVGAIVQATGWSPAEPRDNLSWGRVDDVIRNVDLEEIVRENGRILRPSDGREVKRIAFVQCGGSTDPAVHSYCSSICCLTSLKQSLYLREQHDDGKAYIFYEFMRTPGHYEEFYRRVQEDPGVFLTRGSVSGVARDAAGNLVVTALDTMPGKEIAVEVDLVVLAAGMVPNSADGDAIRELEDAKSVLTRDPSDTQKEKATETVERLARHEGSAILNLNYRQGPDLPGLQYGFPDSHFICFPYESRRTGIYPAGSVRQPMDGISGREDGAGAAMKAVQCLEMTARGEAVHPRAGDRSYPEFALQRCTQCKRCTEECPFGVLNEDDKGTPLLRATRCRRCGVCMGACPERIVSFKDYSVDMVVTMIKAVNVPDEFDEKPRVLALMCENDAYPALELAGERGLQYSPFIRVIPVRCLGSVNTAWVKEAVSSGYDGVMLFGCKYGDDYQCHFIKGSELAVSRGENIREKLEQMAMETERVEIHQLQISDYDKIPGIIDKFMEDVVEQYGMNPFKGM